ncbi:hypothetical protein FSARC_10869 [Fusarium sarcochroum]|uniref:Uncharacterized protein n=1 Tax=Fusarium sarcochroum TaxID=1208366 RepID=A0A8H4X2K5_9HYPO|nr:hypothetical protein FSARC_10869 [Fusarium sarcochroum]
MNLSLWSFALLLTSCTVARDASNARLDAAVSSRVKDAEMPARNVSIHVRHVTDLLAVLRRARVLHQGSKSVQTEQQSLEGRSESLGLLEQSWPLESLDSESTYGNFDDFVRLTEHQFAQASQEQSDNPNANHASDGFVSRELHMLSAQGNISPREALEALDESFWCRVLRIYEEEVGMMYPFLDINQLSNEVLNKERRPYFDRPPSGSLHSEGVENIAFLVLAIVSSFEGSKAVEIVNPVVEEAFVSMIPKIHLQSPRLSDLTLMVLIDDSSHSLAYLKEMVSFCSIASDVRSYFLGTLASKLPDSGSTQDYLQFRVVQWQQNLPHRLHFNGVEDQLDLTTEKRGDYKLRLMLYLRANQMRTIILRKAANRLGSNNIDTSNFQVMIQVARDSIQVLARLARDTDIYHAQHKTFNHFLETALSSLLLVTCYAGSDQSKACLEDVVTATQLIHRLATESLITRRLRDKLQSIRKATDELRSQRCTGNMAGTEDSTFTGGGDSSGPVTGTETPTVDQDSGFLDADSNPLPAHTTSLTSAPILSNGGSTTANIPIGLFDLDTAEATWADTDPSLFTNLSQILGNCESFAFF